jgi:hypothetical protein
MVAASPGFPAPAMLAVARAAIPGPAAAGSASATAALATPAGCGRDTSLARIAASTVIFIVGIGASRLSLARTAASLPPERPATRPRSAARHGTAARPLLITAGIRWIAACQQERTPGRASPEGGRLWR